MQYCAWGNGDLPGSSPDACPWPLFQVSSMLKKFTSGPLYRWCFCSKYPPLTSAPKAWLWFCQGISPDYPCLSRPFTSDQHRFPSLTLHTFFQLPSVCPGCAPYVACHSCLPSSHLTVMWGQLVQQLFDPVFLPRTVDIGNLVLWEAAEKLVYLGGQGGMGRNN